MANYSRWEDVKNKRPAVDSDTRAGIEQDLALGQLIYDLRTEAGLSQRELAERMGTPAYLIDGAEDLKREWFDGVAGVGITAGASAPEVLVRGVVNQLRAWGAAEEFELQGRPENVTFSMPKELRVREI